MNQLPWLDWNGNGRIDPSDIALSLAAAAEADSWEDDGEEGPPDGSAN